MAGEEHLGTLVMVVAVADLPPRLRLPVVVAETALGILVGPHLLGLVQVNSLLTFFGTLGLAFLFFMAGLELDLARVRGRPIQLAFVGWGISVGLGLGVGAL